jgi:RimJ/RimL family protein N-acetyltransferase
MQVERLSDAQSFLAKAGDWLGKREAEHCLLLGLSYELASGRKFGDEEPFFGIIEKQGRILGTVLRTPPHNVLLSDVEEPEAIDLVARKMTSTYQAVPGVLAPSRTASLFAGVWEKNTGRTSTLALKERIHECDEVDFPPPIAGRMRLSKPSDKELVVDWVMAFYAEAMPNEPGVTRPAMEAAFDRRVTDPEGASFLWEVEGRPVSFTGCAGRTPNGIRIAPVYTPPELRGHGYASSLVAAVTQHHLDRGRHFCFLFTDLANTISNKIYERIGYRPVTDVDQWEFE